MVEAGLSAKGLFHSSTQVAETVQVVANALNDYRKTCGKKQALQLQCGLRLIILHHSRG